MGLDWGFRLKKDEIDLDLSLTSFSGWNSKSIFDRLKKMGKGTEDEQEWIVDAEKLFVFGEKLNKIVSIFNGISDREIAEQLFPDGTVKEYADLCYDLDIEYDDFNIFCLLKLNTFIKFLDDSDVFPYYNRNDNKCELVLWGSW